MAAGERCYGTQSRREVPATGLHLSASTKLVEAMLREINGKRYDTDTAERIATYRMTDLSAELPGHRETLYKTPDGEYFVHEERWELGERRAIDFEPAEPESEELDVLSEEEARQWCYIREIDDDIVVNEFECNIESLEEQRKAVVETVEGLIRDVEDCVGRDLTLIRKNTNIARAKWAHTGEYESAVRAALIQLRHQIQKCEGETKDVPDEVGERVAELSNNLEQRAALPPTTDRTR